MLELFLCKEIVYNKTMRRIIELIVLPLLALAAIGLAVFFDKPKDGNAPQPLPQNAPVQHVFHEGPSYIYPDANLTPGALNPDISQENVGQTICNPNWSTKSIRPPVSYTSPLKVHMLNGGYTYQGDKSPADYELDHLISLELGGSPTSPENLWPESYKTQAGGTVAGAKEKDKVENYLHSEVCAGKITLSDAQKEIVDDWYRVYLSMSGLSETYATTTFLMHAPYVAPVMKRPQQGAPVVVLKDGMPNGDYVIGCVKNANGDWVAYDPVSGWTESRAYGYDHYTVATSTVSLDQMRFFGRMNRAPCVFFQGKPFNEIFSESKTYLYETYEVEIEFVNNAVKNGNVFRLGTHPRLTEGTDIFHRVLCESVSSSTGLVWSGKDSRDCSQKGLSSSSTGELAVVQLDTKP